MEDQHEIASSWDALGLSDEMIRASHPGKPLVLPEPADAISALREPDKFSNFESRMSQAVEESVVAYVNVLPTALKAKADSELYLNAFDAISEQLARLDAKLSSCEGDIIALQSQSEIRQSDQVRARLVEAHVSTFVDEVVLDPGLVRHIVDGRIGDKKYIACLSSLRKKAAVFEMHDTKRAAAYQELRPILDRLTATAATRVRSFLRSKIDLLRKPNTNVEIIKQNVLVKHRELIRYLEDMSPSDFHEIKGVYVDTIANLYLGLFRRYANGLMALRVTADTEFAGGLVGSEVRPTSSGIGMIALPSLLSGSNASQPTDTARLIQASSGGSFVSPIDATTAAAVPASAGLFTLGNRLDVVEKIDAPAVVLAVAEDNNLRFHYEDVHRSLGRMLSETCASEHTFCESFFGDAGGTMFGALFEGVVDLLVETVSAHASASNDMIGILLALKVNEAQRTSMQHRNIFDLSDYFIRVDIALKPKFKRLFDANVKRLGAAKENIQTLYNGDTNTKPISLTRRFAELSSAVLSIAIYGAMDDAIQEGLRRLRTEFNSLLMAVSALFKNEKSRYIFLVNNVDLVMTVYSTHGVDGTPDARFFNEVQVGYTAAYVEQEVSDHFPDLVAFVRLYDRRVLHSRTAGFSPGPTRHDSEAHVRAVLLEFASNWHLGAEHMRENVLRLFPNYRTGNDILRALFARLFSYHKRCEAAVNSHYPSLRNELVAGTEIAYEVRQLSKPIG
jgi:vacuolar protein sorting-associated protein 52